MQAGGRPRPHPPHVGRNSRAANSTQTARNAPSRRECELRRDELAQWLHGRGQDPAAETLFRDWDDLTTFYDFPAEHWLHIRTTNPIESTFSTLRHRTKRVKGAFSKESALAMMLQLAFEAEKRWHKITGVERLGQLIEGVHFVDGVAQLAA